MRIWHEALLPLLDRQRLLAQHREICAMRGKGWSKKHSTVQYALNGSMLTLYTFHIKVMEEMLKRGYNVEEKWISPFYRGKLCKEVDMNILSEKYIYNEPYVYKEHTLSYLKECLDNLKNKNVDMKNLSNLLEK